MRFKDNIKHDAKGKWFGILTSLGIGANYLTGKHTQCPICGGKDRFRWDNKDGDGTWFCNQDGAGDGFNLLIAYHKTNFKDIKDRVKAVIGSVDAETVRVEQTDEQKKEAMKKVWKESKPSQKGDFVDRYLIGRGIDCDLKGLRSGVCYDFSSDTHYETMIAVVLNPEGKLSTLHRTFLMDGKKADIESPRKVMPSTIIEGSAVRMGDVLPCGTLGVAEGIETALSAKQMFGVPVWSVLNSGMMEKWQPPAEATSIVIFGDNDWSYGGQKSAYALAARLYREGRKGIQVSLPDKIGTDWNDTLLEWKA